jgi:hypothetical protein
MRKFPVLCAPFPTWEINLDDMNTSFISEPGRFLELPADSLYSATTYATLLEFCSSGKLLQGLLTQRLGCMLPLVSKTPGAKELLICLRNRCTFLTQLKCQEGVPSATLAKLHGDICSSLKEGDHSHLKPSRHIHNTNILEISFVRARVEYVHCFKILTSGRPKWPY